LNHLNEDFREIERNIFILNRSTATNPNSWISFKNMPSNLHISPHTLCKEKKYYQNIEKFTYYYNLKKCKVDKKSPLLIFIGDIKRN